MAWPGYENYIPGKIGDDGRVQRPAKRSKYGNDKTTVGNITFDSGKEADRWVELSLLSKAGLIGDLNRQVSFSLNVNGHHICDYVADFIYTERPHTTVIVEDVKSDATRKKRDYRIKCKLMLACHGIVIRET